MWFLLPMKAFQYYIADVFTSVRFGGNQLAVFPDASGIPEEDMPRIAREFNFSETTFVFPPRDPAHTRRVRIFTPGEELPFAGHPTVGTAFVLATIGAVPVTAEETRIVFEEGVGPIPVTIRSAGSERTPRFARFSVAKLPEFATSAPDPGAMAGALGLRREDVAGDIEAVSCGVWFLFVPLRDRAALSRARVRGDEFNALLAGEVTQKVFLFCHDPELPGSQIRGRMFAPGIGVPEDPATGSACAALGGYLARRDPVRDGTLRWRVEQGFEMGRPSLIDVEADKAGSVITAIRVGGESVLVSKGEMYL